MKLSRFARFSSFVAGAAVLAISGAASADKPTPAPASKKAVMGELPPTGAGPRMDIVFVIDSTGSMGGEIENVKSEVTSMTKEILAGKPSELILVGLPRNMDGTYGPAAEKVREFVARLKDAVPIPVRTWDERLTSAQANRVLLQGNVRRADRKQKVDAMAAAILLQSFLDAGGES